MDPVLMDPLLMDPVLLESQHQGGGQDSRTSPSALFPASLWLWKRVLFSLGTLQVKLKLSSSVTLTLVVFPVQDVIANVRFATLSF